MAPGLDGAAGLAGLLGAQAHEAGAVEAPAAAAVNDRTLRPLREGRQPCYADDHILGHHLWSWLAAWAEWRDERPGAIALPAETRRFDGARWLVDVHGETRLHLGWSRGGAFRLFVGDELLASDTGPALVTDDGESAVTHVDGSARVQVLRREDAPLLYAVMESFHRRTGVPALLNTSFNHAGEPIVNDAEDTARSFARCRLDALVVPPHVALARAELPLPGGSRS